MKKKIFIILKIIILLILIIFLLFLIKKGTRPKFGAKIIAADIYSNYASDPLYNGFIFLDDGSIYEFSMDNKSKRLNEVKDDYNKYCKELLRNTTEYFGKVNEEDLKSIMEYSKDIVEEELERYNTGLFDWGHQTVYVFNYTLNKKIEVYTTGDNRRVNTNPNSIKLNNLIKKYTQSRN